MRRLLTVFVLVFFVPMVLPASGFDWLVRQFTRETGAQQTYIPFFGLVRAGIAIAHPAGTSELQLAIFEHVNVECLRFTQLTDEVAGQEWKALVRVRSRNGQSTNIYSQQNGKDLRLLVTSLNGGEATFVQVRIKPEQLLKFIDDHRRADR